MKTTNSSLFTEYHSDALRNLQVPSGLDPYDLSKQEHFIEESRRVVGEAIEADKELGRLVKALRDCDLSCLHLKGLIPTGVAPLLEELAIVGVAEQIGEVFGYKSEREGTLIHHLIPDAEHPDEMSSRSFSIELPLHTDANHMPDPGSVDFLCLLCKSPEPSAATYVCPNEYIVEKLDPQTQAVLHEDFPSFPATAYGRGDPVMLPILAEEHGHPRFRLGELFDYPMDEARLEARRKVYDVVEKDKEELAHRVVLQAGDLLIFNNHRVLHGRSVFDYKEASKRHVLRVFVTLHFDEMRKKFSMSGRIL